MTKLTWLTKYGKVVVEEGCGVNVFVDDTKVVHRTERFQLHFQVKGHHAVIDSGGILSLGLRRRLYINGFDVENNEALSPPLNIVVFIILYALAFLFGLLFGLIILIPLLLLLCICCFAYRNVVIDTTSSSASTPLV